MFTFRHSVAEVFTNDPEIVSMIINAMGMLCSFVLLDAVHGVNSGIIRALGRQFDASMMTLICYYVFGLPLALYFAFELDMRVPGLWAGFVVAMFVLDVAVLFIIYKASWKPL